MPQRIQQTAHEDVRYIDFFDAPATVPDFSAFIQRRRERQELGRRWLEDMKRRLYASRPNCQKCGFWISHIDFAAIVHDGLLRAEHTMLVCDVCMR